MTWAGPYLAAMIEGEGYVAPESAHARVTISNQNVRILDMTARALEEVGVVRLSSRMDPRDRTVAIAIYGQDNFERIWEAAGPYMASAKRDRLEQLANRTSRPGGRRCVSGCTCGRHQPKRKGVVPYVLSL